MFGWQEIIFASITSALLTIGVMLRCMRDRTKIGE